MYYVTKWYGELIPNLHLGQESVVLSWSKQQNRVNITTTTGKVIHDITASEIHGSELTFHEIKLKIDGKWRILYYRHGLPNLDRATLAFSGRLSNAASMATGMLALKEANIEELQSMISAGGHKAAGINFGRALALGVVGFFVLIASLIAFLILRR